MTGSYCYAHPQCHSQHANASYIRGCTHFSSYMLMHPRPGTTLSREGVPSVRNQAEFDALYSLRTSRQQMIWLRYQSLERVQTSKHPGFLSFAERCPSQLSHSILPGIGKFRDLPRSLPESPPPEPIVSSRRRSRQFEGGNSHEC